MAALLLSALPVFAQQRADEPIQKRLQAYFEATENKEWESVIDMIHPPLIAMSGREEMLQMFNDMEGNGMVFNMSKFGIKQISPVFVHEEQRYAQVDYAAQMSIQFTSEAYKAPEIVEQLRTNFEQNYGEQNVLYEAESNTFLITADKAMYAIAATDEGADWYFMEKESAPQVITQLIPEEVQAHFKE